MEFFRYNDGQTWKDMKVEHFLSQISVPEDSSVIVAGTLINGYGNKYSDFDVHIFCSNRRVIAPEDFQTHDWIVNGDEEFVELTTLRYNQTLAEAWKYWEEENKILDVRYWTYDDFEILLKEFALIYEEVSRDLGYIRTPGTSEFGIGDYTTFSKIFEGVILQGRDKLEGLFSIFDRPKYCYLAYRYHLPTYDDFKDIVGALGSDDVDNATVFARNYVELAAWSFSHLLRNPSTNRKWVLETVKNWPIDHHDIAEDYIHLYFLGQNDDSAKRRYVLRALQLADEIFLRSVSLQRSHSVFDRLAESEQYWRQKLIGKNQDRPTNHHSEMEFEWYKRIFSEDFLPSEQLIEKHRQ